MRVASCISFASRRRHSCTVATTIILIFVIRSVDGFAFQTPLLRSSVAEKRSRNTPSFLSQSMSTCDTQDRDAASGPITSFLQLAQELVQKNEPIFFRIKGSRKSANNKDRGLIRRIEGRPIKLSKGRKVTQATFKYHGATDVVKNWDVDSLVDNLSSIIIGRDPMGDVFPKTEWDTISKRQISHAWIQTVELESNGQIHRLQWSAGKQRIPRFTSRITQALDNKIIESHDRTKQRALSVNQPIWEALGIAKNNEIKPKMASKYRQCQKFVEIVSRLIPESNEKDISIVDMGCGRGYLTFSLHSFLLEQRKDVKVRTKGIEMRPKLVTEMNAVVRNLQIPDLSFECGTIDSFLLQQDDLGDKEKHFSVVIALHACDSATDDAIWSGLVKGADVLVVAPCCHKQVRPQLDSVRNKPEHPFLDIFRHGIYRERVAEIVTDTIRALILELHGYDVQVFEFIGGEHTSKNVMITAVNTRQDLDKQQHNILTERIKALANLHGIRHQSLADRIGIDLQAAGSLSNAMSKSMALIGMPKASK